MKNRNRLLAFTMNMMTVFTLLFAVNLLVSKLQPTVVMDETQAQTWYYYDQFSEDLEKAKAYQEAQPVELDIPGVTEIFESWNERIEGDTKPQNVTGPTQETLDLVNEAKELIRQEFGGTKKFHWNTFENIEIKECDLPYGTGLVVAYYLPEENTIYFVRDGKTGESRDLEIVVHELIHSLTCTTETEHNFLIEGATEYLAQQIVPLEAYSYEFAYPFAEAYALIHGRDALVDALADNTLIEKIDEDLGKDVMETTNEAIGSAIYGFSNDAKFAVVDVYCHYVAKYELNVNSTMKTTLYIIERTCNKEARRYFVPVISCGVLV